MRSNERSTSATKGAARSPTSAAAAAARLERWNSITWTDSRAPTGTMSTGSGSSAARTTSTRQSRSTDGPSWNEHARHPRPPRTRRGVVRWHRRSPGRRIRPVAQTCAGGMQCAGEGRPMTLTSDELQLLERWWRAANYLTVGQIYLQANPLLREPLQPGHIKPRLLGHWGTSPGINLVWAHLNRLIVQRDQKALLLVGPGHGGPA